MNYQLDPVGVGSNYPFGDKMMKAKFPRSAFDWSHDHVFTMANAGLLMPVFFDEVLPASDYSFSVNSLIRVLPQVVPLYSRQWSYIHGFYIPYSAIWNMASVYFTKGYNGKRLIKKPTIKDYLDVNPTLATKWNNYVTKPGDLFTMLDIPSGFKVSDFAAQFTILPFVALALIYKHFFLNKNLYIEDRRWLPDDDADFRIGSDGNLISNKYAIATQGPIDLFENYFRDYQQDYFTSALPFQQRGDAPVLNVGSPTGSITIPAQTVTNGSFTLRILNQGGTVTRDGYPTIRKTWTGSSQNGAGVYSGSDGVDIVYMDQNALSAGLLLNNAQNNDHFGSMNVRVPIPAQTIPFSVGGVGFTLDQFRNLAVAQSELERMARTDGSYFEFGLTFFGEAARYAQDYRPTYFGGTIQQLAFSEVVQNSESTDNSPLGSYAGHGIVSNSGNLGSFHSDEHGYAMCLLSIMPESYYSQGVDKKWTRLTQAEEFLPGRDKLGLTPIYERELYFQANAVKDGDLFAYQNPFDDYRYKKNRISGKIADKTNLSFSPYTQGRIFTEAPTYSEQFFKANNIRKDYLAAPTEDAYTGRISFNIRAVEPLSFTGEPAPIV